MLVLRRGGTELMHEDCVEGISVVQVRGMTVLKRERERAGREREREREGEAERDRGRQGQRKAEREASSSR
ncbi:hypothetical protein T484DRAFT_1941119 [Baffinella frigidus]|nr:hypothetical protein T484DRAFT_1941119 [Cryptophyta sp. CCMP2293]